MSLCSSCKQRRGTTAHHVFPQYKAHRKRYGKLLDEPFNIRWLCIDCHIGEKNLEVWNERKFRLKAEAYEYQLPEGSKSLKED